MINMETSLKASFAQIFSCCPKILSCPKFGGAAAPLATPPPCGPYAYGEMVLLPLREKFTVCCQQ